MPGPTQPLTGDDFVAAALAILDAHGLPDLSMRRIADAVGVKVGAIYWHHENKQSLLAGVTDVILAEVPPPGDGPWEEAIRGWAAAARGVLLRHRDAAELVASTLAAGLSARDPALGLADVLRRCGLSPDWAGPAGRALVHFVLGHVMQEQTRRHMLEVGVLSGPVSALDDDGYAVGVQLLLDGIARAVTDRTAPAIPGRVGPGAAPAAPA